MRLCTLSWSRHGLGSGSRTCSSLLRLAQHLGTILEREGRGARMLEAAFFRADGKVSRIGVRTGEPLRHPVAGPVTLRWRS